jgi:DNA-directed RNA polymerase
MHDQQLQVEDRMYRDAYIRRDRDNQKHNKRQAWSESKIGRTYTTQATSKFVHTVEQMLANYDPNRSGSNLRAIRLMVESGLEPEVLAYLFSKTLYNLMPLTHRRRLKTVTLCMKVGEVVHDELRIRFFAQNENRKALLKKLFKTFDKRTYPRDWRKRTILNYFHAEQLSWNQWSQNEKLVIGHALLVWFRDSTGLVVCPRGSTFVDPAQELTQHIEETLASRVLEFMLYKPMLCPPIPWSASNLFRGGYLDTVKTKPYPLVKGTNAKDKDRLMAKDWSQVIPAINALQETPWRINRNVLDVLEWAMYQRGGGIAGLPLANDKDLPKKPEGYRVDEEITKAHDKLCFLIHSENREVKSKRLLVLSTIAIARAYRTEKEVYFPHNLDSRGRAYPLPVFLNPQGPDSTKALLEFAHGEPIENEEQACWLAIAGANAYGNDKVSLQERVNWVQDNEELIFSVAKDPKHDLRWTTASEPFQFLRFCFEWSAFWRQGYGFMSHMVTPVDATCSGLQHYSAMLRDEVGGKSVNLVPNMSRQDIYQDVADKTVEKLMRESNQFPVECANLIKFGIDRKITKRQVMVVPYAGTFASCMEYTREAVLEKIKDGHPCAWNADNTEEHTKHMVLLSKLIWEAIDEVVVKGKEAMRWISTAAREYTKWANDNLMGNAYDKRMSWVTPDGFEVVHYRSDAKKNRVETYLDGNVRVRLQLKHDTQRLSSKDMALAVAPNFVHSMDAALLRMSIMRGLKAGIHHYGMVHDSFGVHAAKMSMFLRDCVKPAFIDMYQQDVLQQFADKLPNELELEPLPTRGTLALEGVQDSEFFFS